MEQVRIDPLDGPLAESRRGHLKNQPESPVNSSTESGFPVHQLSRFYHGKARENGVPESLSAGTRTARLNRGNSD
jgi:hypothetical protein